MTEKPKGMRFSHLYVARGEPSQDSAKARHRLSAYLHEHFRYDLRDDLASYLSLELGRKFDRYLDFAALSLVEFLDLITCTSDWMRTDLEEEDVSDWIAFAKRVLNEENLAYEVDDEGGVHFKVDHEFNQNLASTLKGLSESRFKAATASIASVQAALDRGDPRQAVRDVFDAAENIFKTILGRKAARLGTAEIKNILTPRLQPHYSQSLVAQNASRMILNSFEDWVVSAHYYRHAEAEAEPPAPPLEIAILLVSNGLGFVRWLAAVEEHIAT